MKEFRAVVIDETAHWNARITSKAGRLFGVYVYDPDERIHLCEAMTSYFLEPCYVPAEHETSEELDEEITDAWCRGTEPIYMHCRDVERLRSCAVKLDAESTIDDAREAVCANHAF